MRRGEPKHLVCDLAEARLATLRGRSYLQLAELPAHQSEAVPSTKAIIATYRDDLGKGRRRIVVQGVVPGWFGSAFVRAWGFGLSMDGSLESLGERDLWDFT